MNQNETAAVRTEGVWKIFQQEAEEVTAVRDVSLTIDRGEFTALAGPSGSGKTTLLNTIGGLTRVTRGNVWVAGQNVTDMSNQALAQLRLTEVGFIFQAYNLLPVLSAMENAEFPMLLQGVDAADRRARVRELFERTGMSGLEDRRPGKLSGGQQQRVAIARSLCMKPKIMLFYEPTSALDPEMIKEVLDVMVELAEEGMTMIVVTHEMGFAKTVADTMVFMDHGEIVETSPPTNFFHAPASDRTRLFLSQILSH